MNVTSIISAIGNNSSIYPLLVRDCGIEIPSKVYLTYKENENDEEVQKLATRERFLDEYAGSAVWLGGIPLVERIANKIIKAKGFNPNVNIKLLKEEENLQGLNYNIKKFEGKVSKEIIDDLKKLGTKEVQNAYKNMLAWRFAAATLIPIAFIGFILPKMIFASSAKKIAEIKSKKELQEQKTQAFTGDLFQKIKANKQPAFTGNIAGTLANFSTLQKMEVIDGGYALGRVVTARKGADGNRNEAKDIAFKMAGMMYLNYVAPTQIEKILNKTCKNVFKINTNLDPLMLADKKFIEAITNNTIKLPKSNEAKDLLDFVDNNPESLFVKYANKFEKVKMLENGVRDPRAYVNIKKLREFKNEIEIFRDMAIESAKNLQADEFAKQISKFAKRAKGVKTFNILANVGISSFLLAYCLPKAQYAFRRLVTGSELEPGIVNANMNASINKAAKS